jgi:phosphoribosylamine--glycine ligase
MKILIVGGGGREHALAWKLVQSPDVTRIYCAPGNAGTAALGENVPLAATDVGGLLAFAQAHAIDLTVVGPDDALAAGLVDAFQAVGRPVFGPTRAAAQLEWSKIFCKAFLQRHGIPTAAAGHFERSAVALRFCAQSRYPLVIKADGLALGKGVIIVEDAAQAAEAIQRLMEDGRLGAAGRRVLIEEFLRGPECSLHAFVDGETYRLLPLAQDFKRIGDGDRGLNTGGMGAVSPPVAALAPDLEERIRGEIMDPLMAGLRRDGIHYQGLLFPGLLLTEDGPKVLEINARFGDPETQVLLPRLRSDLLPVLQAVVAGRLDQAILEWDARPAVCVIMASRGYPEAYKTGLSIAGLEQCGAGLPPGSVTVFHAGTRLEGGQTLTNGGRVLGVAALGETVPVARTLAYEAVARISFEGAYARRDIAAVAEVD